MSDEDLRRLDRRAAEGDLAARVRAAERRRVPLALERLREKCRSMKPRTPLSQPGMIFRLTPGGGHFDHDVADARVRDGWTRRVALREWLDMREAHGAPATDPLSEASARAWLIVSEPEPGPTRGVSALNAIMGDLNAIDVAIRASAEARGSLTLRVGGLREALDVVNLPANEWTAIRMLDRFRREPGRSL